jgi:hypothetical protein
METKDGRDPAPMISGPERVSLVRDLALGTFKHRQLADKYGRSLDAIRQFASRNSDEIDAVTREMCEPLEVGAPKRKIN